MKVRIEITKKNAACIKKAEQAIIDAMNAVRKVYMTFPEDEQAKHHDLYEAIITKLADACHDYLALGSYLLSDITLRLLNSKVGEDKQ